MSPEFEKSPLWLIEGRQGGFEMKTRTKCKALVNETFEEMALLIGGITASYGADDQFLHALMRNVERLWRQTLDRVAEEEAPGEARPSEPYDKPHPAIERFLSVLQSEGAEK